MAGITGNTSKLYWGGTSGTQIAYLTDYDAGGDVPVIDATSMDDTATIKLAGIPDSGEITFNANYDKTLYGTLHAAKIARTTNTIAVVRSDSSKLSAAIGFISSLKENGSMNGVIKASGTITLSGAMTHATS